MADFAQSGPITTIHDLGTRDPARLEEQLCESVERSPIGVVIPVTGADMAAPPFEATIRELARAEFVRSAVVVLNRTNGIEDYEQARRIIEPLGDVGHILWTDGPRGAEVEGELNEAGFATSPGKGLAVWSGVGYLLADPSIKAFAVHDADIIDYSRDVLVRLCLPLTHPSFSFDFAKAYYARVSDRMYGRVTRLLVTPLLQALRSVIGDDELLVFLSSFRYPLSGESAYTAGLARASRVPGNWGLEVGTLSEVFRNTAAKRCCQVDLGRSYDHKHQPLSLDDPTQGLLRMADDIVVTIYRTLASRGVVLDVGHLVTIRSAYLRAAQDSIRQYSADALMNGLSFDRHGEEQAIEAFAEAIGRSGTRYVEDPVGQPALPTWSRVIDAIPDISSRLRAVAVQDLAAAR